MEFLLKENNIKLQESLKHFVENQIIPFADIWDKEQKLPKTIVNKLAAKGYLGATISKTYGGTEMDNLSLAILNEEIGKGCSATRSLLTVHGMCSLAISRWGSKEIKEFYLPQMSSGKLIGAFALTEPNVGSNAKGVETTAEPDGDYYILNGRKKWITMAQIADVFVVYARCDEGVTAFIVDGNSQGVTIKPMFDLLGVRASMIGEISFENCRVPKKNLLAKEGFGLSHVALTCLDYGRFSIACGCVGVSQACYEESIKYSKSRKQFDNYLKDNQLIQKMITEMTVKINAARLLCYKAAYLKEINDPDSIMETWQAKYFSSKILTKIAEDSVQIHGGNGISPEYKVARLYRDSKLNEIIEGTSQVHEMLIAKSVYRFY
ncbi:hypothetical protein SAMN02745163_02312 [Clostridium cavendishii DSM 21758]|uniref:Acyl-CoA dehydrogenase n=1 Tax=Clostridium cavendishii DSM 21758 TaxID=1121302 RepID=A0A1M6KVT5_9CLOT|nr:acyl-CoA dehydrogenase family protein [Clostridium cavendishii]SHJ63087.1 hypothetical protein SAMN02745163_02312 [Clostridium cavendishii DSM 21758]